MDLFPSLKISKFGYPTPYTKRVFTIAMAELAFRSQFAGVGWYRRSSDMILMLPTDDPEVYEFTLWEEDPRLLLCDIAQFRDQTPVAVHSAIIKNWAAILAASEEIALYMQTANADSAVSAIMSIVNKIVKGDFGLSNNKILSLPNEPPMTVPAFQYYVKRNFEYFHIGDYKMMHLLNVVQEYLAGAPPEYRFVPDGEGNFIVIVPT